jgi:regulator of RNase E activity RraA
VDIDVPIGCGGVAVYPGDIVVGDDDGVMVIPRFLADEVAEDGMEMEAFEAFVMEEVLAGRPVIGLYPPTDKDAQDRYHAYREEKKAASPAKPKA